MEFCEKLIRLRKTHHMTQDDLAQALRVSRQAVYKWECGQSYPEALKLVALKELFGISIDNLLDPAFEVQMPPRTRKRRGTEALEQIKAEKPVEDVATTEATPTVEVTPTAKVTPTVEVKPEVAPVPETVTEPIPAKEEAIHTAPVAEQPKEEKPEKKGFFARLFGRK